MLNRLDSPGIMLLNRLDSGTRRLREVPGKHAGSGRCSENMPAQGGARKTCFAAPTFVKLADGLQSYRESRQEGENSLPN
jgi:hypothetical protein